MPETIGIFISIDIDYNRWGFIPGSTQTWVGYGCAAHSFDHHPITKPEKMQICNLCLNHMFLEGPFFKPTSTFCHVNLDAKVELFWQPIGKLKEKFIENYAFCKNATYYLNQFSNKKGAIGKPEGPKKHPIWAAHPRTHLSTKYPPPQGSSQAQHDIWALGGVLRFELDRGVILEPQNPYPSLRVILAEKGTHF